MNSTMRDRARQTGSKQSTDTAASGPTTDDYGQGWIQQTEAGKLYLSRKEKNVFIIEGTKPSGFAACAYSGSAEQKAHIDTGRFSITAELKCMPGDTCIDQVVYITLDNHGMTDLSSGCDFCGVRLNFADRELRIETHRRNATKQTLFAQPGVTLLRVSTYVTLAVTMDGGLLSVTLDGVSLISNLATRNFRASPVVEQGVTPAVGVATYGRTRCYLKRFRILPIVTDQAASDTSATAYKGSAPLTGKGNYARTNSTHAAAAASRSIEPPMEHGRSLASEEMEMVGFIERDIVCADLDVKFEDIGGLETAKRAINEAVVLPLIIPEFFSGIRRPWKGVLLFGPPGTGKTMLAKAVASSTENITFFNCSSATLTSKWRGDSEKLLRALFNTARARVPSILFFDEIDSMLSQRGGAAEHEASRRFKSEFLIHLDGLMSEARSDVEQPGHLLVLATSNTPWDLDEALRRRLEKRIYVPLPEAPARETMFRAHLRDLTIEDDVDVAQLVARTENYSGADIHLVCRDASMNPMRRLVDGLSPAELIQMRDEGKLNAANMSVTNADFTSALDGISPSVAAADCKRYMKWAEEFGSK